MANTEQEWEEENEIFPDPGQAIMDLQEQLHAAEVERDFFRRDSDSHRTAWEEATAVLGERNVENKSLKDGLQRIVGYCKKGVMYFGSIKTVADNTLAKIYPKKEEENK